MTQQPVAQLDADVAGRPRDPDLEQRLLTTAWSLQTTDGGPIIRLFADRAAERMAGMVFVDGTLAEVMSSKNVRIAARFLACRRGLAAAMPLLAGPHVATVCLQAGLVERGMAEWRPI